jgi:hypothetical protein
MKRLVVALMLATLCGGCAGLDWFRDRSEGQSEAARLMARADKLARDGQPIAARDLYVRVVGEAARDTVHARALYSLARLQADPRSGLRDYRAAQLAFKRLLTEYPQGEWESEARAWDAVLTDLVARGAELAVREAEAVRLRNELFAREAEAVRLRNEAAKVGADLQRLKRIDLNLERKR